MERQELTAIEVMAGVGKRLLIFTALVLLLSGDGARLNLNYKSDH